MTTTTTSLLLLILTVLASCPWWLRHLRRRLHRSGLTAIAEARTTCDCLLRLLAGLQQHRGLSSGWLAGNADFQPRMMDKRRQIETLLNELSPLVAHESLQARPCVTSNDLALFRFAWQTLWKGLAGSNVEQNIVRHSQLIATVLDWLATMGEARIELAMPAGMPVGIARNYSQRLPALAEYLGEARAVGSSVATRGSCPAVGRVRLLFLIVRSESLLEHACASGDLGVAGGRAKTAVERMANSIRESLLAPSGITLSADAYFTVATQAVDSVLAWAEQCGREIDNALQRDPATLAAAGGTSCRS